MRRWCALGLFWAMVLFLFQQAWQAVWLQPDRPEPTALGADDRQSLPAPPAPATAAAAPVDHSQHVKPSAPTLNRRTVDPNQPFPKDGNGVAAVDWDVLAQTTLDDQIRPTFPSSLTAVAGQTIRIAGFMHAVDQIGDVTSFMLLEVPIGCFYCQTPTPTSVIMTELSPGSRSPLHTEPVTVIGTLRLNQTDPEDFLLQLTDAQVQAVD